MARLQKELKLAVIVNHADIFYLVIRKSRTTEKKAVSVKKRGKKKDA